MYNIWFYVENRFSSDSTRFSVKIRRRRRKKRRKKNGNELRLFCSTVLSSASFARSNSTVIRYGVLYKSRHFHFETLNKFQFVRPFTYSHQCLGSYLLLLCWCCCYCNCCVLIFFSVHSSECVFFYFDPHKERYMFLQRNRFAWTFQ